MKKNGGGAKRVGHFLVVSLRSANDQPVDQSTHKDEGTR
jgi:hypothetical protein